MRSDGFTRGERRLIRRANTPGRVQDLLDRFPANFEPYGDTCASPRQVLRIGSCHCIEGALLALVIFQAHRVEAGILDLKAVAHDFDHVVCAFRRRGRWGAVSKSNHAVLRYREPVYRSPRELAMSWFHEYRDDAGRITLRSYSRLIPAARLDRVRSDWPVADEDLWDIAAAIDDARHYPILTRGQRLRRSDPIERVAGKLVEWRRPDRRGAAPERVRAILPAALTRRSR